MMWPWKGMAGRDDEKEDDNPCIIMVVFAGGCTWFVVGTGRWAFEMGIDNAPAHTSRIAHRYHQTETLDNDLSMATVFFLKDPPFNGRHLPKHFRSPRGFKACADVLGGWRWRDSAWAPLLRKAREEPSVFARAETFVRCMLEQGPEEDGVCVPPTLEEIAERLRLDGGSNQKTNGNR